MGATQSAQPSPEELDNLALYPDEVVAALRACFGALATDDLDGDGLGDLCVLGTGALGRITVLLGRGDGTFAIGQNGIVGRDATSLDLADVDRDNVPDIVIFTESFDEMLTITTDGNGNLVRWTR